MGFVVLPALVADISSVYDAYFAAFKNSPVTRTFFPSATDEDLVNSDSEFRKLHTQQTLQYWQTTPTQYTIKCVDTETGIVVGMALWDIYLAPSDWKKGEISWLHGKEKERAEALISPLWNVREKLWADERYLYCHVIAVHPKYQRRGIGELLFKYGIGVAEQTRLPIYIESSKEAQRLYEKMGCRLLKERPIHKSEDLWPDKTNGAKEDHDVALYVWVPSDKVNSLPQRIKLAG
ncbi:acyl-CoA N-acyltransferase [Plenodomus tracheiphilus IPT5]|uniref:Acyl-CoA N-acyltransferase n=1 Tax=Plenodomus tracheiphilus IPT5 TaxID=1408161 RepID=A0A6A7BEY3_9PLEO|nr:acyl-CoA N-acyltransferase [Plenodomus tracheiphilus IPT5]